MTRRQVGIALVAVAIIGLALATLSPRWWTRSDEMFSTRIGLLEIEQCMEGDARRRYDYDEPGSFQGMFEDQRERDRCESQSLSEALNGEFSRFLLAARVELGLVVTTMIVLGVLLGLTLARRRQQPAAWLSIAVASACFIAAIVLVASLPREAEGMKLSASAYGAFAGCIVAVLGAALLVLDVVPPLPAPAYAAAVPGFAPAPAMEVVLAPPVHDDAPIAAPVHAWQRPGTELPPVAAPEEATTPVAPPATPVSPWAPSASASGSASASASVSGPTPGAVAAAPPSPSPPRTVPACPHCSAPMFFVGKHGRWFCSACRVYLQPG